MRWLQWLSDPPRFYVTHDGGISWHIQTLSLPNGEASARLWILAPTFFTSSEGLLPILFYISGSDEGIDIYTTHDSGASWQSTTPLSTYIYQSGTTAQTMAALSLVDMSHIWAVEGNGTPVYTTNDAGQHWATLAGSSDYVNIQSLSFVSSTVGWAINRPDFDDSSILRTIDGGHTWTELFHTHQSQS